MIRRLTIVGLGLLGGSLAKAARAESLAREIVAVGRRVGSLEPALADGAVDRITTDIAEGVAGADLVVLATPVATLEAQLPAVWRAAAEGALVTDVGSAKARIVRAAEALAAKRPLAFVGGHPMAGSNLAGYGVSRADLFRGALVILTPTERTSVDALKRASELWEAVGSRVMSLTPSLTTAPWPPSAISRISWPTPSWPRSPAWIPSSSTWPRAASRTPRGSPPPIP